VIQKKLPKRIKYNSRIDFKKYEYLLIDDKNDLLRQETEINLIKEKINKDFKEVNRFKKKGRKIIFYIRKEI